MLCTEHRYFLVKPNFGFKLCWVVVWTTQDSGILEFTLKYMIWKCLYLWSSMVYMFDNSITAWPFTCWQLFTFRTLPFLLLPGNQTDLQVSAFILVEWVLGGLVLLFECWMMVQVGFLLFVRQLVVLWLAWAVVISFNFCAYPLSFNIMYWFWQSLTMFTCSTLSG